MYDLVVTYLDSNQKDWQENYIKYMQEEIKQGKQTASNRQAFGEERIRDWETLRYFLRGVEKNCDWIRNVIIVMQNQNQIPKWLNTDNERLRVIFHEDYIPKEILPTFNAMEIGLYISNIEGLSDLYVMSDDDYYFINKTPVEMFFREGKTVQQDNEIEFAPFSLRYTSASDGVWYEILNNNFELEKKYMNGNNIRYYYSHLPEARDKKVEQEIIRDNKDLFLKAFKKSKFRNGNQYSAQMFPNILKVEKKCVLDNTIATQCKYATLKSTLNFRDYRNYKIVCFNDTEQLDNFELTKEKLIDFLEMKLPQKSSFEK